VYTLYQMSVRNKELVMERWVGALTILVLTGYISTSAFATVDVSVTSVVDECVALPEGIVPDENDPNWTLYGVEDPDESGISITEQGGLKKFIESTFYYRHENGMLLGVHKFFGQVVYKGWSCDENPDRLTGNTADHMIAVVQQDWSWQIERANGLDSKGLVFDSAGKLSEFVITLKGKVTRFPSTRSF
jgi:hypothetical protein